MKESKEFTIGFGAMLPKIASQLKKQGLNFDTEEVKHFEKLRTSITNLRFADILNNYESDKAIQRLFSKIEKHVKECNN